MSACRAATAASWAPSGLWPRSCPADRADGTVNIVGALRRTLATTGYADVKELQRVEVVLAPYDPS